MEELARELEEEFAKNAISRASGMVIDTMGWIVGAGFEVIYPLFFWFFANQLVCFLIWDLVSCFQFAAASSCNKDV